MSRFKDYMIDLQSLPQYAEGWGAYMLGHPRTACDWLRWTRESEAWQLGWSDAETEMTAP